MEGESKVLNTEDRLLYVGQNIARFRKEINMTQEELAKKAGITKVSLCNMENKGVDHTYVRTVLMIADALGVELRELYTRYE